MTKAITLRLPADLHDKLAKMAGDKRRRRSLHSEILVALEEYVSVHEGAGLSIKRCLTDQGDFYAMCDGTGEALAETETIEIEDFRDPPLATARNINAA